jgi:hypothetical protein
MEILDGTLAVRQVVARDVYFAFLEAARVVF